VVNDSRPIFTTETQRTQRLHRETSAQGTFEAKPRQAIVLQLTTYLLGVPFEVLSPSVAPMGEDSYLVRFRLDELIRF
jgi:hypothetical protein